MDRGILVCTDCKKYIFANSTANQAPRWTGEIGEPPEKRQAIDGQDDLHDFKIKHRQHEVIEAETEPD